MSLKLRLHILPCWFSATIKSQEKFWVFLTNFPICIPRQRWCCFRSRKMYCQKPFPRVLSLHKNSHWTFSHSYFNFMKSTLCRLYSMNFHSRIEHAMLNILTQTNLFFESPAIKLLRDPFGWTLSTGSSSR